MVLPCPRLPLFGGISSTVVKNSKEARVLSLNEKLFPGKRT